MNHDIDMKGNATTAASCGCLRCAQAQETTVEVFGIPFPIEATRMFLCDICGNKRCPHSDDHENSCSGSNAPGQVGSRYGVPK